MENNETALQVIDNITLLNNHFMNKVFDDNISGTQRVLGVILKNDKIIVKKFSVQRRIQNLYGHSTQLEILAEAAVKQERINMAESLLREGMSIEFVVRNSKLTEDEVRILAEKQSA